MQVKRFISTVLRYTFTYILVIFKNRYKLKSVRKADTFDEPVWPKLKKRDLNATKAYKGLCHICGKHFSHLWVHLNSHSDVPTDTCDICGKGFPTLTASITFVLIISLVDRFPIKSQSVAAHSDAQRCRYALRNMWQTIQNQVRGDFRNSVPHIYD